MPNNALVHEVFPYGRETEEAGVKIEREAVGKDEKRYNGSASEAATS